MPSTALQRGEPPPLPMPALGLGKGLMAVPVPKSRAHLDDFGVGQRPVQQSPPSVLHSITSVLPFFGCPAHIRDIHIRIHLPYYLYMMKGLMGDLLCQSQNLCIDGGDGMHRLEAS